MRGCGRHSQAGAGGGPQVLAPWPPGCLVPAPCAPGGVGARGAPGQQGLGQPLALDGVGQAGAWGLKYARVGEGQTSGGPGGLGETLEAWASRGPPAKPDPRGPWGSGCCGSLGLPLSPSSYSGRARLWVSGGASTLISTWGPGPEAPSWAQWPPTSASAASLQPPGRKKSLEGAGPECEGEVDGWSGGSEQERSLRTSQQDWDLGRGHQETGGAWGPLRACDAKVAPSAA